jgi:hypothetical protein
MGFSTGTERDRDGASSGGKARTSEASCKTEWRTDVEAETL